MSIKARLLKNSTIELTASLDKSKVYGKKDIVSTPSPMINVALSGQVDGGITSGLTAIAGPSRHFKTNFSLFIAATYLRKYPEAVLLFYDSEFGSPQGYFIASGISPDRVVHTPIVNIEELRHDIINQIKAIGREDKVIIIIDSIGNLASKKEMDDAESGNAAEDMTRARKLKSLFRQITPYLTLNDIPMIIVNHTYQTMEMYSKAVMSGGCVVENTKIQMYDNTLKNIQDIQIGDLVNTLEGPKAVIQTWNPETLIEGEPECYEIEFEDGYKCTVSENHPFLTLNGWVEAQNLTIKDDIICLKQ